MMTRILVVSLFTISALFFGTGVSKAQVQVDGLGCETIHWGFLGFQRRTVCDGPINPADGGWTRARVIWTPAGYVSGSSYCYRYSGYCTYNPGYYREESVQAQESYYVLPSNVLPDEPGWLPPGMAVLR